ncbi:hypothetical protein DSCO28_72960 (plasmid) [Desulfosarcina ovata subsp. sediminis]|uniref:ParB-like N-terminal domain-containing protein n=1 Tax=Desulfosarcina ovata subsp. sediminis TaxID=885957 RepID=A0A5K8A339_9BACT|nr:ParB/RepB/Spo0J family partition protein [Desulfosarcina ovata]BBO86730.1 hypothetical protein DSCO28_72960 [Desulfosarcina ovata subsp. sediminis]
MQEKIIDMDLDNIDPNNFNFRRNFSGPDYEDFLESVRIKGVIQPIVVRPVEDGRFELVFGERRLRASRETGKATIPAIVRELSRAEAFDLMFIENYQRLQLSEYEEALGFKAYLDENGPDSIQDLSDRTGVKPSYVRRRVAVLDLPEPVLKAWAGGEIKYGYLEQLRRLDDEVEIMEYFEAVMDGYDIASIRELKEHIDGQAIPFSDAVFDLGKEGCRGCSYNTDVQMQLFSIDAEKSKCQHPECFFKKQEAWLTNNWTETDFHKEQGTNGYAFSDSVDRNSCNIFPYHMEMKGTEPCFKCTHYITLFHNHRLMTRSGSICIGDKKCFNEVCSEYNSNQLGASTGGDYSNSSHPGNTDKPRVEWHGAHFREIFFKEQIPKRFEDVSSRGLKTLQLALFSLLKSNWTLKGWFISEYLFENSEDGSSDEEGRGHNHWISDPDLFDPISNMNMKQASDALKAATLQTILYDDFSADGRRVVADHIGIDLSHEWRLTEEYFKKKHKPEIIAIGEKFEIFEKPEVKEFVASLGKKKILDLKKGELVKVFFESGIDLAGVVPSEILP